MNRPVPWFTGQLVGIDTQFMLEIGRESDYAAASPSSDRSHARSSR